MPRNGSGSYSLPEAAFIPNTAISSAAMNSDLSDIGAALTGSLARDGQGGMTAVLPLANTGFTYLSDPNTGIRRTASDTQAISGGGVDTVTVSSTAVTVTGSLEVTGAITSGGVAILPIGLGPLPWSGSTAPAKWVLANGGSLLRASYPDLWTFAAAEIALGDTLFTNGNGTTTFTVADMRGRVPAGDDNMGGGAGSGRLTSTTMTPDGQTLGAVNTAAGGQTVTLATANLPAYTPAGSVSTTVTSATVSLNSAVNGGQGAFGTNTAVGGTGSMAGALGLVLSSTLTGTAQGGTSTALTNVQPTIITNYIIYAGA